MIFISKTLGLVLLLAGLIIIAYTLYTSYNIFTAKAEAPEIFEVGQQHSSQQSKTQGIEAQIEEMIGQQLKGLLPVDSIPTLLNLVVWSIFAGILVFTGAQISGLGIKLLK